MRSKSKTVVLLIVLATTFGTVASQPLFGEEYRTWKSSNGKFEVEAKFVRENDGKIVLEKRDGKKMSVALDRLSPADQGFVEGLMAAAGDSNPFEEMEDNRDSGETGDSNSVSIRNLSVDYTRCPDTVIQSGKWHPNIPDQPELPFELKVISLPGNDGKPGKYVHGAVNTVAKRAVLTYHSSRHGQPSLTRMTLVDLENGDVLADATGDGLWTALAIEDAGERIVVQNMDKSDTAQSQLGTVRLKGSKVVPLDLWVPYAKMEMPDKEKVVRYARFVNNGRLVTVSQSGQVVVWDFEKRKAVRRFAYHGACEPSLTHDRKYLAICGGDLVGFVNLENRKEAPSVKPAPGMNYWLNSALSPSCKRFAAAVGAKLMVWDVATGDVLFEGAIPNLSTRGKLVFPHEDFVMVGGERLVEIESGLKVWRYHGAPTLDVGGKVVYVSTDRSEGKLLPTNVPHEDALTWLDRARADSDLFVLKKDASVALDVSGVPGQYRGDVEQSLKQQIDKMGYEFARSADVVFKATITGPTTEAVSYMFSGSFVVKQYQSKLNIMYKGKSIWARSGTNVPGAVSRSSSEEIKRELAEAGRAPNTGFFGGVHLPEYLQKPTDDGKSGDGQTLGSSRITINGLE